MTAAESADPPPKPAPIGNSFFKVILNGDRFVPISLEIESIVLSIKSGFINLISLLIS